MTPARILVAVAAFIGWCALALQAGLTIQLLIDQGMAPLAAVWRFVGWFTVLTNLFCAIVLVALVLNPEARTGLSDPRVVLSAASSIALVGIVYSVALRSLRDPTGLDLLADRLLHDVMPVLFVIVWLVRPHGAITWRDALWCAVFPGLYAVYALVRGAIDGWYGYWFLDPSKSSLLELARNVVVLLIVVAVIGLAFVGIDRLLARKRPDTQAGS
jgi:hypothetical protein